MSRSVFEEYLALSEEIGDLDSEPMGPFDDPRVATSTQTCFGCPDAYEGQLKDGRFFYFRYRYGMVGLSVGEDESCADDRARMELGDSLAGVFTSSQQRDAAFTMLLDEIDG